ncbi:DEAD/DEAH box helicase [Bradyrhizobium betae]|uniref:DNA 3'-5' helicase II n=1 Tax=Bradyrhizobium betae TaxID=244734 RepID=A0A5P6P5F3_9BRAD|nr:ATP-binding domain-containing protein [Bradyrhizobium betae]MCS3729638.1 superfamily I DNA and RNA helicase [Bradyrhizobium betae]QFI73602.1 helicase [Bradyrhizobium betae]
MTIVVWGSTKKPVTSLRLAEAIEQNFPEEGMLYIGYPVLSASDGASSIDALWISPKRGLIIFHLVEGRDVGSYQEVQDEFANNLETRLRAHRALMQGRSLLAPPRVITYAPMVHIDANYDVSYPLTNDDNLITVLNATVWDRPDLFAAAHSVIQSISSIRQGRRRRTIHNQNSRGAVLKALEDSIANLDSRQSRAVIETVEGVQRIRGLAGSGKTIILALKAAYLHAQHPDWRIAVTFNTRSLKGQFRKYITDFVFEQTRDVPDWTKLQILNGWGAPGSDDRTGVYYQFCRANGVEFFDFSSARKKFGSTREFSGACQHALTSVNSPQKLFDVVLVDEAQDFGPEFLRLCYAALSVPKRLVYAYDELQSLTESTLPPPEELFGTDIEGRSLVTFAAPQPGQPSQDIILEKCYRNSRPVLASAHALGFGIYRNPDAKSGTGLIQMFDRSELWEDVGYSVVGGELKDGAKVSLSRTPHSSPEFLETPATVDQLIEFIVFNDPAEQAQWIADAIEKNIKQDELNHSDIIVINPDPLTTVKQVGAPRLLLFERGIQSHVAGVDTDSDVFFKSEDDSVAFTGIFRAKGNEAGMVYIMNAQDCYYSFGSLQKIRNQIFTAITRSKAWVKVLGFGPKMERLKEEFARIRDHDYRLDFTYPDEETRRFLKVVNRDLTAAEKRSIKGAAHNVRELAAELESGRLMLDDLPKGELRRLRELLDEKMRDGNA